MSTVDAEWSKRVDFEAFNTIDELIDQFDAEMQLLKPLHLRRMNLIKITHTKDESCRNLLRRFMEGAKVSDLPTLNPQGILLHLFLDKCPERDDTREIKNQVLEVLRTQTSVQQCDLDTFMTFVKERESSQLSRIGKATKTLRATSPEISKSE